MKIGLVTCELTHGHGWAHYSSSLATALVKAGADVTVLAARNSPMLEGVDVHPVLPMTNPQERWIVPKLAQSIGTARELLRQCDIIHVTVEPYAPLGAWITGKRPFFITGHGSYVRLANLRRWPINALYRWTFMQGRMVCVSHYTEKVTWAALPGVNTVVVNNGVDLGRVNHRETENIEEREEKNLTKRIREKEDKRKTVLCVGAVKAHKGTLELVRAMAVVREQIPDAQCIIIGNLTYEPEYVTRVKAAIDELGLEGCVRLLGYVPEAEVMDWYAKADLFALPSMNIGWKFEGYGLVHLEASAAGLPVIGTRDCGAEDAIDDGVTGLLVSQAGVKEELPRAIIRVLSDPAMAQQMGEAGRKKAMGQTWDHVAGRMLGLYNEKE